MAHSRLTFTNYGSNEPGVYAENGVEIIIVGRPGTGKTTIASLIADKLVGHGFNIHFNDMEETVPEMMGRGLDPEIVGNVRERLNVVAPEMGLVISQKMRNRDSNSFRYDGKTMYCDPLRDAEKARAAAGTDPIRQATRVYGDLQQWFSSTKAMPVLNVTIDGKTFNAVRLASIGTNVPGTGDPSTIDIGLMTDGYLRNRLTEIGEMIKKPDADGDASAPTLDEVEHVAPLTGEDLEKAQHGMLRFLPTPDIAEMYPTVWGEKNVMVDADTKLRMQRLIDDIADTAAKMRADTQPGTTLIMRPCDVDLLNAGNHLFVDKSNCAIGDLEKSDSLESAPFMAKTVASWDELARDLLCNPDEKFSFAPIAASDNLCATMVDGVTHGPQPVRNWFDPTQDPEGEAAEMARKLGIHAETYERLVKESAPAWWVPAGTQPRREGLEPGKIELIAAGIGTGRSMFIERLKERKGINSQGITASFDFSEVLGERDMQFGA